MQVDGNSGPIHLNPPVEVLSTCTVLFGLIFISTFGSRGRLILPTMTNSPCDILAVVMNISACALPPQVIAKVIVAAALAPISFASMASLPCRPLSAKALSDWIVITAAVKKCSAD
jgi:hypothetical protein